MGRRPKHLRKFAPLEDKYGRPHPERILGLGRNDPACRCRTQERRLMALLGQPGLRPEDSAWMQQAYRDHQQIGRWTSEQIEGIERLWANYEDLAFQPGQVTTGLRNR